MMVFSCALSGNFMVVINRMLNVQMPRGDIRLIHFVVYDPSGEPSDVQFSQIYFSVKNTVYEREVLFQKSLTAGGIIRLDDGSYQIKIDPEDTEDLHMNTRYVFDIELIYEDEIRQTEFGELFLTNEVTCSWNEAI